MKGYSEAFKDIPGTVVFDATQSRLGYHLNMFCMSLMKAENRAEFKAGERSYLARFPMSDEQRDAVLARDYNRMLALGGNIYFLAKIGATDGHSFQKLASMMTGVTEDEYRAMMLAGGRSPEGNRSRSAGGATSPGSVAQSGGARAGGQAAGAQRAEPGEGKRRG
jgi:protocatechuate 4,5-dioxygenase alpha chain